LAILPLFAILANLDLFACCFRGEIARKTAVIFAEDLFTALALRAVPFFDEQQTLRAFD